MLTRQNTLDKLAIAITIAIYAGLAFFYLPQNAYWNESIGFKYLQAENIHYTPLPDFAIKYPGQWLDGDFKFVPAPQVFFYILNNQLHLSQSPLIVFLSQPFLLLFGRHGGVIIPIAAGIISVYLLAHLTHKLIRTPQWVTILLTAFATPLVIYSVLFWEHTLAVAFMLGALWLWIDSPSPKQELISGILAACAVATRKELIFCVGLLTLATFANSIQRRTWGSCWRWCSGLVLVGLSYEFIIYQQTTSFLTPEVRFGVPLSFTPNSYIFSRGAWALVDFMLDRDYGLLGMLLVGIIAIYWLLGEEDKHYARWRETIQVVALAFFGCGVGSFFWQLWSGGRVYGPLSVSPFLLLGLNIRHTPKQVQLLAKIGIVHFLLCMATLITFTSSGPNAGEEWGMRFSLISYILLIPGAIYTLSELWQKAERSTLAAIHFTVAIALVGLSVTGQIIGVARAQTVSIKRAAMAQIILQLPEKQILTGAWSIAIGAPDVYQNKEVFVWGVNNIEAWRAWIKLANDKGVKHFAFVGKPLNDATLAAMTPSQLQLVISEQRLLEDDIMISRIEIVTPNLP